AGREAHRLQRDARIEVDIRIELLLDEILILERDALELHRDVQERIVLDAELVQDLMTGLLHYLSARVVVLIDAMPEAHQAERIVLVLRALDEFRNAVNMADIGKHLERGFVRPAMRRSPKTGAAGGNASEGICAGRAGEAHG